MGMVSKNDLLDLTKTQLQNIIKEIYNLHNKNKFYGKKLLSFDNSGHIKIPERKIKEPDVKKIETKKLKALAKTKKGQLFLLERKFKALKNPSLGQIEAFKAKLRVIKKME